MNITPENTLVTAAEAAEGSGYFEPHRLRASIPVTPGTPEGSTISAELGEALMQLADHGMVDWAQDPTSAHKTWFLTKKGQAAAAQLIAKAAVK